jgi:hypothetical protein
MLFQIGAKHIVLQNKIKADKTTDEQAFGVFFLRSAASFVFHTIINAMTSGIVCGSTTKIVLQNL